jgi:hypothetical protein
LEQASRRIKRRDGTIVRIPQAAAVAVAAAIASG